MISLKRASHSLSQSPSPSSHSDSDIDACRNGKRRRQDNFASSSVEKPTVLSTCENRVQMNQESPFATTSAQFNLFSRPSTSTGGKGRRNIALEPKSQHERQHGYLSDLVRLRSSAFWELRQSISENGEGLVRRMRDYEHSRSRHHKAREAEKRERKKPARKQKVFSNSSDASDEEDDEIFISSGESANHILRGTFLHKPTDPIAAMDVDSEWTPAHHPRSSSPLSAHDTPYTTHSPASDDDSATSATFSEEAKQFPHSPTRSSHRSMPSLSHSREDSPCSSVVSLPLPSSSSANQDFFDPSSLPHSSLASEKAVAALNLALANGAGSINDYSPVNHYEEIFPVEHYDHGDLWN